MSRDLPSLAKLWYKGFPEIAPKYALIPGDPKRIAMILEQMDDHTFLSKSEMHSDAHIATIKGVEVLVTATGVGCPAAAIVVEILSALGIQCFIRVGSAGGIQTGIEIGHIAIATAAIRNEGTTHSYLPAHFPAVASQRVIMALTQAAIKLKIPHHVGVVHTGDALFAGAKDTPWYIGRNHYYPSRKDYSNIVYKYGAVAGEMECAAVFTVAKMRKKLAGAVLAIDGSSQYDLHGNLKTRTSVPRWSGKIDPVATKQYIEGQQRAAQTAIEAILYMEQQSERDEP